MGLVPEGKSVKRRIMYVSLFRLYVEVSQQNPLLYIGLIVLLMASWALIVSAVVDIVIRVFDVRDGD